MRVRAHQPLVKARAEEAPFPAQGEWTYDDYRRLPDDGWRYEVLQGNLHMTPAPAPWHQATLRNLTFLVLSYLQSNPLGEVYFAPIDVLLPGGLATPVQPDLIFLARERLSLVSERGIEGAPDLVAEVLSPSNWLDDRRTKFEIYAAAGVREYWLLDPRQRTVEVFVLEGKAYALLGKYVPGEPAQSQVLPGFSPLVARIFGS